jgi:hypothetical protein
LKSLLALIAEHAFIYPNPFLRLNYNCDFTDQSSLRR